MGSYGRGFGSAFSTSMKLWHLGRQEWLPGEAFRLDGLRWQLLVVLSREQSDDKVPRAIHRGSRES